MLNPVLNGLFEDVKAEDKDKICVQVKTSFVLSGMGA